MDLMILNGHFRVFLNLGDKEFSKEWSARADAFDVIDMDHDNDNDFVIVGDYDYEGLTAIGWYEPVVET